MKRASYAFLLMIVIIFSFMTIFAASVPPQLFPGNDSNPKDYTPPKGCIHYEIPRSGNPGTYTVKFNDQGQVDPNGTNIFQVTVGTMLGKTYTQVLSWSSNFPIYAVIVKGGNAFNLYQYPTTTRSDTNLVSPINASGKPADVSHLSIVVCSKDFPKPSPSPSKSPETSPSKSPEPSPSITPHPSPSNTACPSSKPCPPTPSCPCQGTLNSILIVVIIIAVLILLLLCFSVCGHDC